MVFLIAEDRIERLVNGAKAILLSWNSNYVPIFISGVSGSGTSLISVLLDQNYKTAGFADESAMNVASYSPLKMRGADTYGNVNTYYRNMFLKKGVSSEVIQTDLLKYYRRVTRLPKVSKFILDKSPNTHLVRASQLKKAFPQSKFLIIIRNPLATVEGLIRKWQIFEREQLPKVCEFYGKLHKSFLNENFSKDDVCLISYETVVDRPEEAINYLASLFNLEKRKRLLKYPDHNNNLGKNIRNVRNGRVIIDKSANKEAIQRLTPSEQEYISGKLMPLYKDMRSMEVIQWELT